METARPRVLDAFPYPIAYPYELIFAEHDPPSNRRWALCFTTYQLLRLVGLSLVSQYLRQPIDEAARDSIAALNRAVAALRSPFFSDWITLLHTLRKHLPRVGLAPSLPLDPALAALKDPAERPVGLRGNRRLDPLNAILALRNETAHGGLPDQDEARAHLDAYLPVLHQLLAAFDFFGDVTLAVCADGPAVAAAGRARVRTLRGARPGPAVEEDLADDLADAFAESPAVLIGPRGQAAPLYPLLNPVNEAEPLYLYDGHYGIRVGTAQGAEERSYIYYLGTHHRATDGPACGRLKELLARRQISFFLDKEETAPWTIADSAADYSRRTLDELLGTKYFPPCYVPFADLERHFGAFLRVPEPAGWGKETSRRRYVNGFLLVGLAGAGKTAFLARQVEQLLQPAGEGGREGRNLVLFLRGNGIALRPDGLSLFRDVAEKLGIAVEGATVKARSGGGFSSSRELFDHLHARWKQDRLPGRRLILVLDALNEAPFAEKAVGQALELVGLAACYPWCKVVLSTRQEWLGLWSGKLGAQEASPLEEQRPFLYAAGHPASSGQDGPPVVPMEPFTEGQARQVYERYQAAAGGEGNGRSEPGLPACRTPWGELPAATRALLRNPLYLHLFMEAFRGRPAEAVTTVPALFRQYVERALRERPGLGGCVAAVLDYLLDDLARPSANLGDDDCNAIRRAWAEGRSAEEARLELSPVEGLAHEGLVTKRVREEGGGYRFVFQAVAEYLIYRHLAAARPAGEDEGAYWGRRAAPAAVFPEYAGAFAFLLRDWAAGGRLAPAGPLLEASHRWLGDVATGFLIEQARTGHVAGEASPAAAAAALASSGSGQTAAALHAAGYEMIHTQFARASTAFFQACIAIREALWAANPDNVAVGAGLGAALNNLGNLLRDAGRVAPAEAAYRRSVEIAEALWAANPDNVAVGDGLGTALNNLGNLLRAAGRVAPAEAAYRRSVEIAEALWAANPDNVAVGAGLGTALNNLGNLLRDAGRVAPAEAAYRRSVEIREALWAANPDNVAVGAGLGSALNNLGNLLSDAGRVAPAEAAYRRAVEIAEALWAANPDNVAVGDGLGSALNNLGLLLSDAGRVAPAEAAYRRSVEIREALWAANPDNVAVGAGLGAALNNLGNLLSDAGRVAPAEAAYRRSVEIREALWAANPDNVAVGAGLGSALNNLGLLLRAAGRVAPAEAAYRRSVEIAEALWAANPDNVAVGDGLGAALNNLGNLLRDAGRVAPAEAAYRRSVEIREALWAANPDNVAVGAGLGTALNNLGNLLRAAGRVAPAEAAYRRSVEIAEALWAANPDNVAVGAGLGAALNNLGNLLSDAGRVAPAEAAYRRSVEIAEALWAANPDNVAVGDGLGSALNNLGNLLRAAGRVAPAEAAYRRSVEIREALWAANPDNVEIKASYAGSLCSLRRFAEAERLIHEVLALMPQHPYANQLHRYIRAQEPDR